MEKMSKILVFGHQNPDTDATSLPGTDVSTAKSRKSGLITSLINLPGRQAYGC